MVFRIVIAVSLLFPLIGVLLLELGWYGPDINQVGHPNGATLALAIYSAVILATIWFAERFKLFHSFGAATSFVRDPPRLSLIKVAAIFVPMVAFVLSAGGLDTILGHQGSGGFRLGLTSLTGVPSYLIVKCYAPATFAYVALESRRDGNLLSPQTIIAGLMLTIIAMSFGYKTGIILALLPAITLLCWYSSWRTLIWLGVSAFCIILVAYIFKNTTYDSTFVAFYQRLFLWNGGVPWKVWGLYESGSTLPSYVHTLPAIFSDRLFTMLTGITRSDTAEWVMSHFSLMATHLAGYPAEFIMREGHNNAANAFSEGILAGGIAGAFVVAVIAGLIIDALYRLIDNRLKANDFAIASLAACYLVYALMSWLLGGGIAELMHSSVIFGMLSGYLLLRFAPAFGATKLRVSKHRATV